MLRILTLSQNSTLPLIAHIQRYLHYLAQLKFDAPFNLRHHFEHIPRFISHPIWRLTQYGAKVRPKTKRLHKKGA